MAKSFPKLLSFIAKATAYYPPPAGGYASEAEARLEGGALDRMGKPLHTLQDVLEDLAPYVAVAMDPKIFPYGTLLSIPSLNLLHGKQIEFRVVDTGEAFDGKGHGRIDICVRDKKSAYMDSVNREVLVIALVLDGECRECLKKGTSHGTVDSH